MSENDGFTYVTIYLKKKKKKTKKRPRQKIKRNKKRKKFVLAWNYVIYLNHKQKRTLQSGIRTCDPQMTVTITV